jgi:hypothetical protein
MSGAVGGCIFVPSRRSYISFKFDLFFISLFTFEVFQAIRDDDREMRLEELK